MSDLTGQTLGRYRILDRIGRGGMAEVYKAYQPSLDRYVAVKVLHPFLLEEVGSRERFQREARAVAALRHPNIVQVFDFDTEGDRYFMVMEFVDGPNLKAILQDQARLGVHLGLDRVEEIITAIGGALGYAHQQGMIHRDVKPHNILFTATGQPLLTDFGIAKIVGGSQVSASGALSGTPAYMSPEQGRGALLDVRTDLYSLGVVLYEMAVGRVPFDADTPFAVVIKHINDPLPLPHTVNRAVPEGLERVILKALAKTPDERFQTAEEFVAATRQAIHQAEALPAAAAASPATSRRAAHAAGRLPGRRAPAPPAVTRPAPAALDEQDSVLPVPAATGAARPPVAPRPLWLAIAGVLALLLVVGLGALVLLPALSGPTPAAPTPPPVASPTPAPPATPPPGASPTAEAPPVPPAVAIGLDNADRVALLHTLSGHTDKVRSLAFAPDSQTLASTADDATVRLWRVGDGTLLHAMSEHLVLGLAFAPDGQTLIAGTADQGIHVWQLPEGTLARSLPVNLAGATTLAVAPDGQTVAVDTADYTVRLWSVADGTLLHTLEGPAGAVRRLAFAPDGQTLAAADDHTVRLWRVADGTALHTLEGHTGAVTSLAFAADGQTLASGSEDGTVRLWRSADGTPLTTLGSMGPVASVAFAPDGQVLAAGLADGTVHLWSVGAGAALATLRGHAATVTSLAFAPDGRTLASGSEDKMVELWGAGPLP